MRRLFILLGISEKEKRIRVQELNISRTGTKKKMSPLPIINYIVQTLSCRLIGTSMQVFVTQKLLMKLTDSSHSSLRLHTSYEPVWEYHRKIRRAVELLERFMWFSEIDEMVFKENVVLYMIMIILAAYISRSRTHTIIDKLFRQPSYMF